MSHNRHQPTSFTQFLREEHWEKYVSSSPECTNSVPFWYYFNIVLGDDDCHPSRINPVNFIILSSWQDFGRPVRPFFEWPEEGTVKAIIITQYNVLPAIININLNQCEYIEHLNLNILFGIK